MLSTNIWNQISFGPKIIAKKEIPIKTVNIETLELNNEEINSRLEIKSKNEFMHKKRGRITKSNAPNQSNPIHDKFSDDNLKRKVKTHYHNYIVAFLNMKLVKKLDRKNKFGKLSSNITQNISVEFNRNLFMQTIKNIIVNISEKYNDKTRNLNILQSIMESGEISNEMNEILNMTYKDFYINYYLKSTKKDFINIQNDESYEHHLEKMEKLFGKEYAENYDRNAKSLIIFFNKCKQRKRKVKIEYLTSINKETKCYNNNKLISEGTQTKKSIFELEENLEITFNS